MEWLLDFDELVNAFISEKKGMLNILTERMSGNEECCCISQLYYIALVCGRYDFAENLDIRYNCRNVRESTDMFLYAKLYNEKTRENAGQNILNRMELFFCIDEKLLAALYHLLKNHCYDIAAGIFELIDMFDVERDYFSTVMTAAVKNRYTEGLKLFLERGYIFTPYEFDILMSAEPDYMRETVLPLMGMEGVKI